MVSGEEDAGHYSGPLVNHLDFCKLLFVFGQHMASFLVFSSIWNLQLALLIVGGYGEHNHARWKRFRIFPQSLYPMFRPRKRAAEVRYCA